MKSIGYSLLIIGYFIFFTGNRQKSYEKGYEAAWEEERAPSRWASKEERKGYEDGLEDVWTYDEGYYDGYEGKRPKYFNDSLYMEAYKEGKEYR
jgi:hypothetical protein